MSYGLREIAKDVLAGKVVLAEAELANERLKVCQKCDAYQKLLKKCSVCGCMLELKTRMVRAECPLQLW